MARERPMLMTGELVRATLEGRKTVTRRPVTRLNSACGSAPWWAVADASGWFPMADRSKLLCEDQRDAEWGGGTHRIWPRVEDGDRLYVRETWAPSSWVMGTDNGGVVYRATERREVARWRPSIHMPKWAARLWLDVVSVRVERVQDITEDDAKREGVKPARCGVAEDCGPLFGYRTGFVGAWRGIYGDESWATNPWVWRIEYAVNEERTRVDAA